MTHSHSDHNKPKPSGFIGFLGQMAEDGVTIFITFLTGQVAKSQIPEKTPGTEEEKKKKFMDQRKRAQEENIIDFLYKTPSGKAYHQKIRNHIAVEFVDADYFPENKGKDHESVFGLYDAGKQRIFILRGSAHVTPEQLSSVLFHEICHALDSKNDRAPIPHQYRTQEEYIEARFKNEAKIRFYEMVYRSEFDRYYSDSDPMKPIYGCSYETKSWPTFERNALNKGLSRQDAEDAYTDMIAKELKSDPKLANIYIQRFLESWDSAHAIRMVSTQAAIHTQHHLGYER